MICEIFVFIISIFLYVLYINNKAPKHLADIPSVDCVGYTLDMIRNKSFDHTYQKRVLPYIESKGYAKVWWLGRWAIYVKDVEMISEIYTKASLFRKSFFENNTYGLIQKLFNNSNIISSNSSLWKIHQKISNPALHEAFSTETIGKCVTETINEINKSFLNVDIENLLQRTALDILGKAIFNYDIKAITQKNNDIVETYKELVLRALNVGYLLFPYLDKIYKSADRKRGFLAYDKFDKIMDRIIKEKQDEMKFRKNLDSNLGVETDLLLNLIIACEEGKISKEELKNNILVFFVAGHDTTANSLSTIIGYLCKHPEIQNKAYEEIVEVMGNKTLETPTNDQLNKMKYLMRIIKEGTRIVTNFPTVERCATSDYEFKNGLKIKEGTIISIHSYGMHHDPKIYKNPYEFDPDRFINDVNDKNWKPFADGSRTCIGMNFSITEQKTVLSMLLANYEFKFSKNSKNPTNKLTLNSSPILIRMNPYYVDFKKRSI